MEESKEWTRIRFWQKLEKDKAPLEAYLVVEQETGLLPLSVVALLKVGAYPMRILPGWLLSRVLSGSSNLRDVAALVYQLETVQWRDAETRRLLLKYIERKGDKQDRILLASEIMSLSLLKACIKYEDENAPVLADILGRRLLSLLDRESGDNNKERIGQIACLAGEILALAGNIESASCIAQRLMDLAKKKKNGDLAVGAAQTLLRLGRLNEAMQWYQQSRAMSVKSQDMRIRAVWGIGMCGLLMRHYNRKNFCAYVLDRTIFTESRAGVRRWRGEKHCTVVVESQQGIGEELFFMRFAGLFSQLHQDTMFRLRVSSCLCKIIRNWHPDLDVVSKDNIITDKKDKIYRIAAEMIPYYMGVNEPACLLENLTSSIGYGVKGKCRSITEPCYVGVVWRSSNTLFGRQKTVGLRLVEELLGISELKLVSLQHDMRDSEIEYCRRNGIRIPDLGKDNTWEKLYSQILKLQCIVCCSTATGHLAATMGKKTFVLLTKSHTNNWMWNHDSSGKADWYLNTRVYKQKTEGEWLEPIHAAVADCKRLVLDVETE